MNIMSRPLNRLLRHVIEHGPFYLFITLYSLMVLFLLFIYNTTSIDITRPLITEAAEERVLEWGDCIPALRGLEKLELCEARLSDGTLCAVVIDDRSSITCSWDRPR